MKLFRSLLGLAAAGLVAVILAGCSTQTGRDYGTVGGLGGAAIGGAAGGWQGAIIGGAAGIIGGGLLGDSIERSERPYPYYRCHVYRERVYDHHGYPMYDYHGRPLYREVCR